MNRIAPRVALALAFAIAACLTRPVAAADDYAIKFDRPAKVGEQQRVNFTGTDSSSVITTVNGQKAQEQKQDATVTLEGEMKTLEVSDKGRTTKYTCLVKKCQVTKQGQTTELLPAGKVIEATHEAGKQRTTFKIDGAEVQPELGAGLAVVLPTVDTDRPSDDEVLGSRERKKIGDTWDVNKDLIAAEFIKMKLPIQKDSISGKGKLVEVKPVAGVPCEFINFVIAMPLEKGARMPNMPEWLSLQSGKLDFAATKIVTVDPDQQVAGETPGGSMSMTAVMSFSGNSPEGAPVTITVTKSMQKQGTTERMK